MLSSNTSAVSGDTTYIEDVFSTYLRTGTNTTSNVVNGIDLSTKGGVVWFKSRNMAASNHIIYDTARGAGKYLYSNSTNAQNTNLSGYDLTAFNVDGYTLGTPEATGVNDSTSNTVAWTFRKQPKFFTQGTFTGNGANRTISHDLGSAPGMIIVKRTDTTAPWIVYHRSLGATKYIFLNATSAASTGSTYWNNTDPTSTVFSLGTEPDVNGSGGTFVYYAFAHDAGGFGLTGTDNVISCGSFLATNYSNGLEVNLGWEPQWLLVKNASVAGTNWVVVDNMRGLPAPGANSVYLQPNTTAAEVSDVGYYKLTSTGFQGQTLSSGVNTFIYIAIRRGPMKVPTDGTKVFSPVARTGTGSAATVSGVGFSSDLVIPAIRTGASGRSASFMDRLRGPANFLGTSSTSAETATTDEITALTMDGMTVGSSATYWLTNRNTQTFINYFLKRAPSFFDEVCYTGTGVTQNVSHNLTVAPELLITKNRTTGGINWFIYSSALGNNKVLNFDTSSVNTSTTTWNSTSPTTSVFTVGADTNANASGDKYVAYLFATCPGVSKVGSFVLSGSDQTINCGFAAGARFILLKDTGTAGRNWHVWDTARGINSGATEPYLDLNTTAAESTIRDWIEPNSSGFTVKAAYAASEGGTGQTFIYLAIA